ncbi:MAG: hypothetical protein R2800_02955 [Flavipsychrobacter sp.]
MRTKLFLLAILTIGVVACKKTPKYSSVPRINYRGITTNTVTSGSSADFVQISFNYTDGEGDFGYDQQGSNYDIYFLDRRFKDTADFSGLYLPNNFRKEIQSRDLENGISGIITFQLDANRFLVKRPNRPNGDTTSFEVYIKDLAGNESNRITTDEVYILP